MKLEPLIIKYLDDPFSLSDEELSFFVEEVSRDKKELKSLKELVLLNDLFSRELTPERSHFKNQLVELINDKNDSKRILKFDDIKYGVKRDNLSRSRTRRRRADPTNGSITSRSIRKKENNVSGRRWFMLAALLFLSFVSVYFYQQNNGYAGVDSLKITLLKGSPKVLRKGKIIIITKDHDLLIGDEILIDEKSYLAVSYKNEKTNIEIFKSSELRLKAAKEFYLVKGHIKIEAAKQLAGKTLEVETGTSLMTVVGTKFEVIETPASEKLLSSSRLEVFEGVVKISNKFSKQITLVKSFETAIIHHQRPTIYIQNGRKAFEMNLAFFETLYQNSLKSGLDDYSSWEIKDNLMFIIKEDFSVNCDLELWEFPLKITLEYKISRTGNKKEIVPLDFFWYPIKTPLYSLRMNVEDDVNRLIKKEIYISDKYLACCSVDNKGSLKNLHQIKNQKPNLKKRFKLVLKSPVGISQLRVAEIDKIPDEVLVSFKSLNSSMFGSGDQDFLTNEFKYLKKGKIQVRSNGKWFRTEPTK